MLIQRVLNRTAGNGSRLAGKRDGDHVLAAVGASDATLAGGSRALGVLLVTHLAAALLGLLVNR